MKLAGFFLGSIVLNGLLLVLILHPGFKQRSHVARLNRTVRAFPVPLKLVESTPFAPREYLQAFHWAQLESEDYRVYVANLRELGCPEATVRDIILADVNELFYRRVKDLVDPAQVRFWELMADRKEFERVVEEKAKQIEELQAQRSSMLQELLGKFERKPRGKEAADLETREVSRQFTDFLAPEKADEYLKLDQKFAVARDQLASSQPPLAQIELQAKSKLLQEQFEGELGQFLSPDEMEEYRLRKSNVAELRMNLPGFEVASQELRELAHIESELDGAKTAEQQQLRRERMTELLGPDRFVQFERAQNPQFQEIYQVAERYDLSPQAMVDAYEMRKATEEQVRELRASQNVSSEDRAAALQAIHKEIDMALIRALGPEAFATYRSRSGQWLDRLEALP